MAQTNTPLKQAISSTLLSKVRKEFPRSQSFLWTSHSESHSKRRLPIILRFPSSLIFSSRRNVSLQRIAAVPRTQPKDFHFHPSFSLSLRIWIHLLLKTHPCSGFEKTGPTQTKIHSLCYCGHRIPRWNVRRATIAFPARADPTALAPHLPPPHIPLPRTLKGYYGVWTTSTICLGLRTKSTLPCQLGTWMQTESIHQHPSPKIPRPSDSSTPISMQSIRRTPDH